MIPILRCHHVHDRKPPTDQDQSPYNYRALPNPVPTFSHPPSTPPHPAIINYYQPPGHPYNYPFPSVQQTPTRTSPSPQWHHMPLRSHRYKLTCLRPYNSISSHSTQPYNRAQPTPSPVTAIRAPSTPSAVTASRYTPPRKVLHAAYLRRYNKPP